MNREELTKNLLSSCAGKHWERIGVKRRAGVLFPLFSLYTKQNMGIGEFPDLKLLVDWCVLTGNSVIQLLPVNDSGVNNFPYSALTAFALNPIFLSPIKMDGSEFNRDLSKRIFSFIENRNLGERVLYSTVLMAKMRIFEAVFEEFERENVPTPVNEFDQYCLENEYWLDDYSLFMTLKEKFKWASWEKWQKEYKDRDTAAIIQFTNDNKNRIRFYSFLQWQAEKQFLEAHQYAAARGVFIKGDIPFLVGRDSADVWVWRRLFNMDTSSGAPPDMFSQKGQKWGSPTFNWENMKANGYEWYIRRLRQAQKFFDIYRIDHAIGLYRIYTIDKNLPDGSVGCFDPQEEATWEDHGEELIKMMLNGSHMLPIAEDLGVVPNCVRPSLRKLGIPRTLVDRWERNYQTDSSYIDLSKVDPVSMNTLSTHDTETIRQWWYHSSEERNLFYQTLGFDKMPSRKLSSEVHQQILKRSYGSNCLFSINLPQDIFNLEVISKKPAQHRINVPSTVSKTNWSYRFPVMLEELCGNTNNQIREENCRIRELIEGSSRI